MRVGHGGMGGLSWGVAGLGLWKEVVVYESDAVVGNKVVHQMASHRTCLISLDFSQCFGDSLRVGDGTESSMSTSQGKGRSMGISGDRT